MAEKKFEEEIMSDEELDGVAGGTSAQTADDSRFLNSLNGSTDRYGEFKITLSFGSKNSELARGWSSVGIKVESFGCSDNKYYLNGQQITQEQARQHAMNVTGHHMTESEWKW